MSSTKRQTDTDTLAALIVHAAKTYDFRARGPFEGQRQYLAALIAHVQDRDYAMAHELRLGRRQADWTHDDIEAFRRRIFDLQGPPLDPPPRGFAHLVAFDGGHHPVTEAALLDLAARGLAAYVEKKQRFGTSAVPILANVLLTDGRLCISSLSRGDRVAFLKWVAQSMPMFGFFLIFDAFLHRISEEGSTMQRAEKVDALLVHVGTRELRRMIMRPYRVFDGRALFDDPPPPDLDKRGPETLEDPYAGIFVSVPGPTASPITHD